MDDRATLAPRLRLFRPPRHRSRDRTRPDGDGYLARDSRHERLVAIKVLDPELGAVLGADRFLSDIRVTANPQHPNLLALLDSGAAN